MRRHILPPRGRDRAGTGPDSNMPSDTPFSQQQLRAWRPLATPVWATVLFLAIGAPMLGIGFYIQKENAATYEHTAQYDGPGADPSLAGCQIPPSGPPRSGSCSITIVPERDMRGPVSVMYRLTSFQQNHRSYVKSRLDDQLHGQVVDDPKKLSDCDPLIYAPDGRILHPCGLIAQSFFNDTFALASGSVGGAPLAMDESDISWEQDRASFKAVSAAERAKHPNQKFINEVYPNVAVRCAL